MRADLQILTSPSRDSTSLIPAGIPITGVAAAPSPGLDVRLPRVLIVDDEESMRLLTRLVLKRSQRFEIVAEAGNGVDGIVQAGLCRPDLIMLDIDMPLMDGIEALPAIRKASPDSQIVMFSGRQFQPSDGFLEMGAAACIGKNEDWPHVVNKLLSLFAAS